MTVCLSHGGRNLHVSDAPSREVLVGTLDGVVALQRSDAENRWQVSAGSLERQHVSALMIEPTQGLVFAGTHGDGLYASGDLGRTWQPKDHGLGSGNIYSLNFVQANGQLRLYAGTEPAHLYVSEDLGENWVELAALRSVPSVGAWTFPGPPHVAHVKNINFDPRSAETIYASIEVGGLLKSVDGGKSWQELQGFYEDVHRVVIPISHPERLYITGGMGIYLSQDGGETWEHLTDRSMRIGYPDGLIIHPEREELMFVAGAVNSPGFWSTTRTADSRVARSRDGGRTWEMLEKGLPEHIRGNFEAMSMNAWRGGFSLFAGTTDGDVYFSADEGESWSTIARGLPPVSKAGHYRPLQKAG